MKRGHLCIFAISLLISVPYDAHAQTVQYHDLTNDQSRGELAEYDIQLRGLPSTKEVKNAFVFPRNANDAVYGVDVSHHNGDVDWLGLSKASVQFVYIKASQGAAYRDSTFPKNWAGATRANIRHGAYHFLSAGVDGAAQADNYIKYINVTAGGFKKGQLLPVLDMEWDVGACADGTSVPDRWECPENKGKAAATAAAWIAAVTKAAGKQPLIYTAKSWWDKEVKNDPALASVGIWIVDVNLNQDRKLAPVSVSHHPVTAWQFTSVATVNKQGFDANKLLASDLESISLGNDPAPVASSAVTPGP